MSVVQKVFANENFNPISEAPSRAVLFGGVDVPVYAKPWSTKDNEAKIDVISHKNKKGGAKTDYNVFIIEQSPLRFRIAYEACDKSGRSVAKRKFGWVDKRFIGLYADRSELTKLYLQADSTGSYELFGCQPTDPYNGVHTINKRMFILLELREDGFRKVMFMSDEHPYEGWIKRYVYE